MRLPFLLMVILAMALGSCGNQSSRPEQEDTAPWVLRADSMNFAVLIVDYETDKFEAGNVSHYALCVECDTDSMPIGLETSHFGALTYWALVYAATQDTLLYATVIYMGDGDIHYPRRFSPASEFKAREDSVPLPDNCEVIVGCIDELSEEECRAGIVDAWGAVCRLDVVHAFAQSSYRMGVAFYPRHASIFEPSSTDWLFFLYRGEVES